MKRQLRREAGDSVLGRVFPELPAGKWLTPTRNADKALGGASPGGGPVMTSVEAPGQIRI